MDMATSEYFENRVRELASEVEGEKVVTRHIFEQSHRNASDLGAIRAEIGVMRAESGDRLDRLAGDMVLANAALHSHGIRLDSLTRDVGLLRGDATALRRGQEELHARIDQLQADVAARFDRQDGRLDGIDGRLDGIDGRLDAIDGRLDAIDGRLDGIDDRLGAVDGRLDGIDGRLDAIGGRLDGIHGRLGAVDGRLDAIDGRLDAIGGRLDVMERNIAAILAAVVPPGPAPAA
jgi:archaellum component FlaC